MLAHNRFFCLRRLAVPIITLAPEHHHANAQKRTEEDGQEGNESVHIDLTRHHEESNETGDGEENEKRFP